MARFNRPGTRPAVHSPVVTETAPTIVNAKGSPGFARTAKGELFLLAVNNMVGQAKFHESAQASDNRFNTLVRAVAVGDPAWMLGFTGWLRGEANMRTASLLASAETVVAFLEAGILGGRQVIDAALKRPDEPGELLAYWTSTYGRSLPKPVKRGVADAAMRHFNQKNALKYDTASHAWRFADVLELVHPKAATPAQGDLYKYLLDLRHAPDHSEPVEIPASLGMLRANKQLRARVKAGEPALLLNPENLLKAAMTWEDVLSLGGQYGLDKAKLWESIIPSMGAMALVRNLRNMDQAGVSDAVAAQAIAVITDEDNIRRSHMFPLRMLSAYRAAPSLRWGYALETAMRHSLGNVPALAGRTLVLVDRSGSMFYSKLSERSELTCADGAALFGAALAVRCDAADLVQFGSSYSTVPFDKAESVLRIMSKFGSLGGTDTPAAVQGSFRPGVHNRVVIVTDEQYDNGGRFYGGSPLDLIPADVPVYTWNLAGYRAGHGSSGSGNRHTFGGLSDAAFKMVPLLERGRDAAWPWE